MLLAIKRLAYNKIQDRVLLHGKALKLNQHEVFLNATASSRFTVTDDSPVAPQFSEYTAY